MALPGLNFSRSAGRDFGLVDVVDGDVDSDLLPPVLHERVEPLIVCGHEVAPEQDLEVTGDLASRLGECGGRRRDVRRRRRLDCLFLGCASRQSCTRHGCAGHLQEPAAGNFVWIHNRVAPIKIENLPLVLKA